VSESPSEKPTILFSDIGSSVRLYQEVGDVAAHQYVSESLALMAKAVDAQGGCVLRTVGDATLARFDTPDAAVAAAVAIQIAHQRSPLSVRVGFHCGPVIEDRGDVYGQAVNITARIASFARVNEITTSSETAQLLNQQYQHSATLLKQSSVRGVDDPIAIYRIDWQSDQEAATRIATRIASPAELNSATVLQQLEVRYGRKVWVLGAERTSLRIGRTELADVCVMTDRTSRDHAILEYRDGQFTLTDTSTNGTYIRKRGQPAYGVQRESVILDGRGTIGVGVEPVDSADGVGKNLNADEGEAATIHFAVEFGS